MTRPRRPKLARHRARVAAGGVLVILAALAVIRTRTASAAVAHPAAGAPGAGAPGAFHLRLEKSAPSKGEVVSASPSTIRLWFSLPPEMAVTTVKLANAGGTGIAVSPPRRGSGARDPVEVEVPTTLAAGTYTVSWKTSSKDGHPIRGNFAFTVKGASPGGGT